MSKLVLIEKHYCFIFPIKQVTEMTLACGNIYKMSLVVVSLQCHWFIGYTNCIVTCVWCSKTMKYSWM